MEFWNGDWNVLLKLIVLWGGFMMVIEVVVICCDGFNGFIEIEMEELFDGVMVIGLIIFVGVNCGMFLVIVY